MFKHYRHGSPHMIAEAVQRRARRACPLFFGNNWSTSRIGFPRRAANVSAEYWRPFVGRRSGKVV